MSFSKYAKPTSNRAKVDICYSNIRGLRTNLTSLKAFAINANPDFISLSETGLNPSIQNREFDIPGYHPLITKHDPQNRHGHGLGVYVKEGFPCGRDASYEDADSPFMCFRLALLHSTAYIFTLYRPQTDGCDVIDKISSQIDKILAKHPSANIHICGDFNVHHE